MTASALSGKRCLVTGASRGLGHAIAVALAGAGARLFLTARGEKPLRGVAEALQAPWASVDLQEAKAVSQLVDQAGTALGGVDVLVNCAGVFPVASIEHSTVEEFNRCFALNVRAPFQLCRAFTPEMVARRWGRIVNIGSSSAYTGFKDTSVYCASKHALLGLSRALHDELKGHNVRVFCVSPGSIKTDMGRAVRNQDFETFLEPTEIGAFVRDLIAMDGPMIAEEVRLNRMVIR